MKASESRRKPALKIKEEKEKSLPFSVKITAICLLCEGLSAFLYLLTLMMTAMQISLEWFLIIYALQHLNEGGI